MSRMCASRLRSSSSSRKSSTRGAVDDRAVERLVGDVEEPAALGAESAAQGDAVRVLRRRRVERPRRRRLPVHDELPLLLVVHPAPADVERPPHRLEVEPAEAEPALGVLERPQPSRGPGVHRRLRDLAVDAVGRAGDGGAHALEVPVRAVDVRLLRCQLGMAHAIHRNADLARARGRMQPSEPPRVPRRRRRRAVRACAAAAAAAPPRTRSSRATRSRAWRSSTCGRSASSARSRRLADPRSVERVGDVAVVCHTADGALSIVDRTRVRHVVRGFVEPRYMAAHPDGVHAFVTDSGSEQRAASTSGAASSSTACGCRLGAPRDDRARRAAPLGRPRLGRRRTSRSSTSPTSPRRGTVTSRAVPRARRRLRARRAASG